MYLDQLNFKPNSQPIITVLGPPSTELMLDVFDHSDNRQVTKSIITNSVGIKIVELDLTGYTSGIYKVVVSNPIYQNTAKFSIGLSTGSGPINFSSTKPVYSPGESILLIGNTGANTLLKISLIDPNGEMIYKSEIFTDNEGGFTSELFGIPSNAITGMWQIKAQSGLDHKKIEISVIT